MFPDRGLDAQLHLLNRLYGKINVAAAAVGVPTPIIPGSAVQVRDFTTATYPPQNVVDTFPALDTDLYRVMLGTALRTPTISEAIRRFPRKAGGITGDGELRGFVFCFRVQTESCTKAALRTILTNSASLVDQTMCVREASVDLQPWLSDAARNPGKAIEPTGPLPANVLRHLWPALEQARKRVAALHQLANTESDDEIKVVTWLALAER